MQIVEKVLEDKKNQGPIVAQNPNKKEILPIEKTPASSSFLKIDEQAEQIQASPQYFNKQREQAQKIAKKSSLHSSAKSESDRSKNDIHQNLPQSSKFITLIQNGQFLSTVNIKSQYMTPQSSDITNARSEFTPQSSSSRLVNNNNTRAWQTQIIEALTQNPPQFFDSNRLSTFAKHKLEVAHNACKQNFNNFNHSHSKSTAYLHQDQRKKSLDNKGSITPLSQNKSMKNLSLYDSNSIRKNQNSSSPLLLNASIIPQTCKHDLSLNFDFKLLENQNNPPLFVSKMLNRPPSELKAISLYSDRKNQVNLNAKSKSIYGSNNKSRINRQLAINSTGRFNSTGEGGRGGSFSKSRLITTCGPLSSSAASQSIQNITNNSLKLKKSKRYANVESKVKKMIEETTTSASIIKQRPHPKQVCLPVTLSNIHMEESEFLQQQQLPPGTLCKQIEDGFNSSEKRKLSYLPYQRHKRQTSLQNGGSHLISKNLFGQQVNSAANSVRLFGRHQSVPKLQIDESFQFTQQLSKNNITRDDNLGEYQERKEQIQFQCAESGYQTNNQMKHNKNRVSNKLFVIADNLCQQDQQSRSISSLSQQQNCNEKKSRKRDLESELKKLNDQFQDITTSLEKDSRKQNVDVVTLTTFETNESQKGVKRQTNFKRHNEEQRPRINSHSPTKKLATTTITNFNNNFGGVSKQGIKKLKKSSGIKLSTAALGNILEEDDNNNSFSFAEDSYQNSTTGDFGAIISIRQNYCKNNENKKPIERTPFKQIIN